MFTYGEVLGGTPPKTQKNSPSRALLAGGAQGGGLFKATFLTINIIPHSLPCVNGQRGWR